MNSAVKFAKIIIETSMSSQNLSGRSKVFLIHPDQILRELVPPQNVKHLRRVQLVGLDPAHCVTDAAWHGEFDPSSSVIVRTSLSKLICQFISLVTRMSRYPSKSYLVDSAKVLRAMVASREVLFLITVELIALIAA